MSSGKKHEAVFDDVLADLETKSILAPRAGARFLKRSTAIGEARSGDREEKLLHWVDPATCRMWGHHNRAYELLNEENCRDLIDGIRAQGQQEFPAIVRRLEGEDHAYEVICGARRHFAVSWLRANNYPQFKYLVELRDLTDEEAFRLADIENRDREDISDFERARDYAGAIERYYGGKQKTMAARLEVSEAWLSRYLQLAKLPEVVVAAFASVRDLRELHARRLKPLMAREATRQAVLSEAAGLGAEQAAARDGQGEPIPPAEVLARLKAAADQAGGSKEAKGGKRAARKAPDEDVTVFQPLPYEPAVLMRKKGGKIFLELPEKMSRLAIETALRKFVATEFGPEG